MKHLLHNLNGPPPLAGSDEASLAATTAVVFVFVDNDAAADPAAEEVGEGPGAFADSAALFL